MNARHYSAFLHCLYDETEPHGELGQGTHYSIFRTTTWQDVCGDRIERPLIHDFAVIWDEDHDERVIGVIERMYFNGLLHPVLYVGERKGSLTVVLSKDSGSYASKGGRSEYERSLSNILGNVPTDGDRDSWGSEIGVFGGGGLSGLRQSSASYHGMLINDDSGKVETYLQNIHNLWNLGHKQYVEPRLVLPKTDLTHKTLFGKQAKPGPFVQSRLLSKSPSSL